MASVPSTDAPGEPDGRLEERSREIGGRAAHGAALLTAQGALQLLLGLGSTIVVTRWLAPRELGIFAIALTVSSLMTMLTGGQGMAGALIRRPEAPERADLRAYVGLQLAVNTTVALVVVAATLPFGLIGRITAIMVAPLPISAFRGAAAVPLERELAYRRLTIAETSEMLVYYGWIVGGVLAGWGVWALATGAVARFIVGTACASLSCHRQDSSGRRSIGHACVRCSGSGSACRPSS